MSIQQPIPLPVTRFSSDDVGAPQISLSGAPGEIKTILKACLSTGFVDTEPADGWSMPFEDGDKAVFRSIDPRSTGFCFRVDNSMKKGGQVTCYEDMSDIDAGDTMWSNSKAGFAHLNNVSMKWRLFATPVSFLLVTARVDGGLAAATFFGDLMSASAVDLANCFCFHPSSYNHGAHPYINGFIGSYAISKIAGSAGKSAVSRSLARGMSQYKNIAGEKIGWQLYFAESAQSDIRFFSDFLLCDKRESVSESFETIGAREYFVSNLGGPSAKYIYMIPTDFWYL